MFVPQRLQASMNPGGVPQVRCLLSMRLPGLPIVYLLACLSACGLEACNESSNTHSRMLLLLLAPFLAAGIGALGEAAAAG